MVSIPLSYGCSLTGLGRCGARKRDRNSGTTGKITATTRNRAIGPNVPSTCESVYPRGPSDWLLLPSGRGGSGPGAVLWSEVVSAVVPTQADKPRYVAAMFERIARRYDLMNALMTAGQDQRWRRLGAELASTRHSSWILDVGTGTGRLGG